MTETSTLPVELTGMEPEFDQPCQFRIPPWACDHPATFAMWVSHTSTLGCPGTLYVCDQCMAEAIEKIAKNLGEGRGCGVCRQQYTGLISDNVRFIKL